MFYFSVRNQEKMRELNGIYILFDLLRTFTTATVENTEFLKMAITVTSTLDSCLLDNGEDNNTSAIQFSEML